MKITHNPHASWQRPSAVTSPRYEAEVTRATALSERRYRDAQDRLAKAERRLTQASSSSRTTKKHLATLAALVELRREELESYRRMMASVAASAQHRGTKGWRPVPPSIGIPL